MRDPRCGCLDDAVVEYGCRPMSAPIDIGPDAMAHVLETAREEHRNE